MPVYLICDCLEEGGMTCRPFAGKGCCRAAPAAAWPTAAAPAVAAHNFSAFLGCFAMPEASAPLFSGWVCSLSAWKQGQGKGYVPLAKSQKQAESEKTYSFLFGLLLMVIHSKNPCSDGDLDLHTAQTSYLLDFTEHINASNCSQSAGKGSGLQWFILSLMLMCRWDSFVGTK